MEGKGYKGMNPRSHMEVELIEVGCHLDRRDQGKGILEEYLGTGTQWYHSP